MDPGKTGNPIVLQRHYLNIKALDLIHEVFGESRYTESEVNCVSSGMGLRGEWNPSLRGT